MDRSGSARIECELKIGVIVPQKDSKIGRGILCSIDHIVAKHRAELASHGISLNIVECEDHGDSGDAETAAKYCADQGCIAILGPCDSHCMQKVVESDAVAELPKFCTFATATELAAADRAFFRFTHNDSERAAHLLEKLRELAPHHREIAVYTLPGPANCYSDGLRRDVSSAAAERELRVADYDFSPSRPVALPKNRRMPLVICAPSRQAVNLLKRLKRRDKWRPGRPVFAFGSNTNFWHGSARGIVVVADLDRHDPNPVIRRTLREFARNYKNAKEPSVATMSAVEVLTTLLLERPASEWADVKSARLHIIDRLKSAPVQGLRGLVSFDSKGELIGQEETISLLRVRKRRRRYYFAAIADSAPLLTWHQRYGYLAEIVGTAVIVGSVILSYADFAGYSLSDLVGLVD